MIVSCAPFRVSFAGGGSDIASFYRKRRGAVLSCAIAKYSFIVVHPFFSATKYHLKYARTELVDGLDEIQHPILGKVPVIQHWSGPGVHDQSGSGYTVKAVSRNHGPSERFTANLADLDQSTLNIVTGQGGNFLSPYYMDQWKAWYEGTTFTLPFSAKAVDAAKAHRLVLEPGR